MALQFNHLAVQTLAAQMAQKGNLDPTLQYSLKKSPFEQQLMALTVADKVKPDTSLGFLIGQILNSGLNSWRENYDERANKKVDILSGTPEQQKEWLGILQKTDPNLYASTLRDAEKKAIDLSDVLPPPDMSGINQNTTGTMAQAATKGLLGDTDFWQPKQSQDDKQNFDFQEFKNLNLERKPAETAVLGASTGVMSGEEAKRRGYGVDFDPNAEISYSRPATKEDERNVLHSVGTLVDPAANIYIYIYRPWDANLNLGSGYGDRRQEIAQIAETPQPQTQQAPPEQPTNEEVQINPLLAELQQGILRAKGDYYRAEEAYRTATTEQEKVLANEMAKRAHQEANVLRAQMEGMGVDPSNYSKDTTIEDAYKTFASQKARDIVNSMQGQYSVNSDQYYQDKYIEARVRGFSVKEAKRFAGNQAARYKANRATYLDNIFNAKNQCS